MAAVKSPEEQFLWLDNSFLSAATKSVDHTSRCGKRNCCLALPNGQRKTARLQCVSQNDCVNSISVRERRQGSDAKCHRTRRQISAFDADENSNTKVTQQSCFQNDTRIKSAVDVTDMPCLFSEQKHSPSSLVPVFILLITVSISVILYSWLAG